MDLVFMLTAVALMLWIFWGVAWYLANLGCVPGRIIKRWFVVESLLFGLATVLWHFAGRPEFWNW